MMSEAPRPLYLRIADLSRIAVASEHTVRRKAKKLGITEEFGGELVISRLRLREMWGSLYEALLEAEELGIAARSAEERHERSRASTGRYTRPHPSTREQKSS